MKLLITVGIVLMILGVVMMMLCPYTYIETVEVEGETAEAIVTDIGNNPYGIWISMVGLAFIGFARAKEHS